MLAIFRSKIYNSDEERVRLKLHLKEIYCKRNPDASDDEYDEIFNRVENQKLFERAFQKYGRTLWKKNSPWKSKKCHIKCPVADICTKKLLQIDNTKLCYGNLYFNRIDCDKLKELEEQGHIIQIIDMSGKVILKLNHTASDTERELVFLFVNTLYFMYIMNFGDYSNRRRNVNGSNVIPYL